MDTYRLPCAIVTGDYNLREWEAERAKVWDSKRRALLQSPTPAALYASLVYYIYALELEGTRGGGREGGRYALDRNEVLWVSSYCSTC